MKDVLQKTRRGTRRIVPMIGALHEDSGVDAGLRTRLRQSMGFTL
jgi:hypothetical protein